MCENINQFNGDKCEEARIKAAKEFFLKELKFEEHEINEV